jgi:hypothetical protein
MISSRNLGRFALLTPVLVLVSVFGLSGPAGALSLPAATATTFGSNLPAPNTTFGCNVEPTAAGFLPTGAAQCVWSEVSTGTTSAVGSDLIPAGNGTVTTARVHVGATTGPMRFAMIRALVNIDNLNVSCCVVLLESKQFTPAPNKVTGEKVSFPIVDNNSVVDQNLEIVDILALVVRNATTPLPLTNKTSRAINLQPADDALYGPIHLGTAQLFAGLLGYQLDIQGSFAPS